MTNDALLKEIEETINRHSAENASDTPDFLLAEYLMNCLAAFNAATRERDMWHGRNTIPCSDPVGTPDDERPAEEAPPERLCTHEVNGYGIVLPKVCNYYPVEELECGSLSIWQWGFKYDNGVFEFFQYESEDAAETARRSFVDAVENYYSYG